MRQPLRAFTLIELMVTLFIVAVLAVIAGTSFVRASRRSKMSAEVNSVFAVFKAKLESNKLTQSLANYHAAFTDPPDDDTADFWPAAAPDSTADEWSSGIPSTHYTVEAGIAPPSRSVYCRYLAFMGDDPNPVGGSDWPGGATRAATIYGIPKQPADPWYYLVAQCNLEDKADVSGWQEWNSRHDNAQVWLVE